MLFFRLYFDTITITDMPAGTTLAFTGWRLVLKCLSRNSRLSESEEGDSMCTARLYPEYRADLWPVKAFGHVFCLLM